jgi:hypothetical protein
MTENFVTALMGCGLNIAVEKAELIIIGLN